jgi:NAD(P)-dependent dehydrogenase (short-subunit alcohol dehydrogenase family)
LLVSAAGLFIPEPFPECDGASHDFYLELDRAIFFLTQTVARGMAEHGRGGSTVNIGSMRAHQLIAATPSSGCSVAKRGLHALTATLPSSCTQQIRVNAVAPAGVATPIYNRFVAADKLEETVLSFDGFHPPGRAGTARDLANTTFLLSQPLAGSPAPSGMPAAASWPDATNNPGTSHLRHGRNAGHSDHGRTR